MNYAQRVEAVKVHNQIIDTATEAIHRKFLTHGTLHADLSFQDPKNLRLKTSASARLNLIAGQRLTTYSWS